MRDLPIVESPVESLPPLFERWMAELLPGHIPKEDRATCNDCAMVSTGDVTDANSFDPSLKCCTYQPTLPNFLVGRILREDADSFGARTVQDRIAAGAGVSPLGVAPPVVYQTIYDTLKGSSGWFGRAAALRCPHLTEAAGCGIWQARPSTCATWFCKFSRRQRGYRFWKVLRDLLKSVELSVSVWCCSELGIPAATVIEAAYSVRPVQLNEEFNTQRWWKGYCRMWGDWKEREREFFKRCASLSDQLTASDILRLGGVELSTRLDSVKTAYLDMTDDALPSRVKTRDAGIRRTAHGNIVLTTYSSFDTVEVSSASFDALMRLTPFDIDSTGNPVLPADGAVCTPEELQRLVDSGFLTPDRDA